jgi:hypothetical protein
MSTPPLNRRTRLLTGTTPVFEVQPPATDAQAQECPQDAPGAAPAASTPSPHPSHLPAAPACCECGAKMRQVAQLKRVECSAECGRPGWWVRVPGSERWERMPGSMPGRSER